MTLPPTDSTPVNSAPGHTVKEQWQRCMTEMPLVAILRGVTPSEVLDVACVLVEAGLRIIEVPLNSPKPFESIEILADHFTGNVMIGAGTVLKSVDVSATVAAGGKLIVAPNLNADVAATTIESGCIYCPGVATPTEAFSAIEQGANDLKLFPAEMITPSVVKAFRAVLPLETGVLAVGGITPQNINAYLDVGCSGFGIGSALYKPGKSLRAIEQDAKNFIGVMPNSPLA